MYRGQLIIKKMKKMKKYNKFYSNLLHLLLVSMIVISCDDSDVYPPIKKEENSNKVSLSTKGLDFSNYIAVGASFTAGFTDGALFKEGQKNSFPNILASKFAMTNGNAKFEQALMNDNIGGFIKPDKTIFQTPRLYFNALAKSPTPKILTTNPLDAKAPMAMPTTVIGVPVKNASNLNNYGIVGAKSFHFLANNYGSTAALALGKANPYYVMMNPSSSSVIAKVVSKKPTFFTLSEVGGNDVLSYALQGGAGIDQKGNLDPTTYGMNDITNPKVFALSFSKMVDALTSGGAKGVVTNIPYITTLPHFTTVPYNPLNTKTNKTLASQIPTLNLVYGVLNQIYQNPAINQPNRVVVFKKDAKNPVIIKDEDLIDLSKQITSILASNPQFPAFVKSFGLPEAAAPLVAQLLGKTYGQARPATKNDLLVLPSASIIGTINKQNAETLIKQGLSKALAMQFSTEGVTLPLSDKWVLTPQEKTAIKVATDTYNTTITNVAKAKGLALVDFKGILQEATTKGVHFDDYNLTTQLVRGGLISLDGIHLTGRGYALMANEVLKAIDKTYGSNFVKATNGLAKAVDYPINYSPTLR